MPVIIILGILLIWGIFWLKDKLTPPCRPFTPDEIRQMNSEMAGKSKSECKRIIQKYNKRPPQK